MIGRCNDCKYRSYKIGASVRCELHSLYVDKDYNDCPDFIFKDKFAGIIMKHNTVQPPKNALEKLNKITHEQKKIHNEIEETIKEVFENNENLDSLEYIKFYDSKLLICFNTFHSCVFSTRLIHDLDKYFQTNGDLSYSDGDGLILEYTWNE